MTYNNNNNDFFGSKMFGLKVDPVNLFATVINDALANEAHSAKNKVRDFDPQAHLGNLFAAGQEFFEGFNVPGAEQKTTVAEFTPAVDVIVSDTIATYIVGAPGVRQEDVAVELEDAKLTISISSERIITSDEPTRNWKGGAWAQTFTVPTGTVEAPKKIDEENITAVVENGLITVLVGYKAPKVTKIKVG